MPASWDLHATLADARVGRLATVSSDGEPHLVPICFAVLGQTIYTAIDQKPKRAGRLRRVANIAQTGRACLLIDHYDEDWTTLWWIRVDARARIVDDLAEVDRARRVLTDKYEQYVSAPPDGPAIALEIRKISGWSAA